MPSRPNQNLLADPSISDLARAEALQAIQAETEKSLRQTLGVKIFSNYTQSSGQWIRNLGGN